MGDNIEIIEQIKKTREYLDYVEEHVLNVQKAWNVLKEKCKTMRFIWDDFYYFSITDEIYRHDLSKLSENEFIQYRKSFYPTNLEEKYNMSTAWEHHKKHNPHHWENWTTKTLIHPNTWEIYCVHMVCDWMAMGYKFGDTAKQYYESNKEKIKLPKYAINFIYEIFNAIK